MNILIWGIGSKAKVWLEETADFLSEQHVSIAAYIDSNAKDNSHFNNRELLNPSQIPNYHFDYIVIISSFYGEIRKDAIEKYNISEDVLLSEKEFTLILFQKLDRAALNNIIHSEDKIPLKKLYISSLLQDYPLLSRKCKDFFDYEYLAAQYSSHPTWSGGHSYNSGQISNYVWVFWAQGMENAPLLVQACFKSINKHINGRQLVLITKDNFSNFVNIPDYILALWQEGIISHAHFSDILRLKLLKEYGGLWLDAAIYCTDDIPGYIFQQDFFCYQWPWEATDSRMISNWLIYAQKGNSFVSETLDILLHYWKEHRFAINYYIFHFIFRIVAQYYSKQWEQIPYFANTNLHVMQYELLKPYTAKRWSQLTQISPLHKLTYKIPGLENPGENRIIDYILSTLA